MRRTIICSTFAALALTLSSAALAQSSTPAEVLARGREAYEAADFENAAEVFQVLLARDDLDDATRADAHRYLAALELIFEHQDSAREHVQAALEADREATVPDGAPPTLAGMFEELRAALPPAQETPGPETPGPEAPGTETPGTGRAHRPRGPGFTSKWVTLGLGVGVYVPSIVNALLPHVTVGLDVGLLLPFHDRRLAVVLGGAWSPPGNSGEGEDARLGDSGASWDFETTTHEVMLQLGAVYRILPPGTVAVVPYVGLVARLYLLQTTVTGTGNGAALGEHTEQSTNFGGALLVGGEATLGPGALWFELSFGISDLPHRITGDTNTGALALNIGYRLFL